MYILCDYYVFGLSGIASDLHAVLLPLKLVQTRFGDFAKAALPKLQVIGCSRRIFRSRTAVGALGARKDGAVKVLWCSCR